jgi:hypothetical protein
MNSIYYTPKRVSQTLAQPKPGNRPEINSYNAPIPSVHSPAGARVGLERANGIGFAPTPPTNFVPARQSILKKNQPPINVDTAERIDELQRLVEDLRSTVDTLEQELGVVRAENSLAGLGIIKVRFLEDSLTDSAEDNVVTAGTVMLLRSPYENNDSGLWATRQTIVLGMAGLEILASSVQIARRVAGSLEKEGSDEFIPLVEIIDE